MTTYEYDGQRIIVEGFLLDERFHESCIVTGEKFPPGVIHYMAIRLLINCSNFVIEDIDADLISVPRDFAGRFLNVSLPLRGWCLPKVLRQKQKLVEAARMHPFAGVAFGYGPGSRPGVWIIPGEEVGSF